MNLYNQHYRFTLPVIFVGILFLIALLYRFIPSNAPLTQSAGHTSSQSVSGDCHLRQNTHHTRVDCAGNFTFKTTPADSYNIFADVSGHNNHISVRSAGTDASAHTNNISVSQFGNGSSVRITFADNPEATRFDQQWTLNN